MNELSTWALRTTAVLALAGVLWLTLDGNPKARAAAPQRPTPQWTHQTQTRLPVRLVAPALIVRKGQRRLEVYDGAVQVAAFRIALGFAPQGHKKREGDGRTPEGEYIICTKNPNSRFHLSLGISYPNAADAAQALADGRITRHVHDQIIERTQEGRTPPWKTVLGGEIFIHGHGTSRDWTLGCVALENEVVEELYRVIPVGTRVQILP